MESPINLLEKELKRLEQSFIDYNISILNGDEDVSTMSLSYCLEQIIGFRQAIVILSEHEKQSNMLKDTTRILNL